MIDILAGFAIGLWVGGLTIKLVPYLTEVLFRNKAVQECNRQEGRNARMIEDVLREVVSLKDRVVQLEKGQAEEEQEEETD